MSAGTRGSRATDQNEAQTTRRGHADSAHNKARKQRGLRRVRLRPQGGGGQRERRSDTLSPRVSAWVECVCGRVCVCLSAFLGWWVLGVWVFFGGVWCVFWFFDIFGLLWLRAFWVRVGSFWLGFVVCGVERFRGSNPFVDSLVESGFTAEGVARDGDGVAWTCVSPVWAVGCPGVRRVGGVWWPVVDAQSVDAAVEGRLSAGLTLRVLGGLCACVGVKAAWGAGVRLPAGVASRSVAGGLGVSGCVGVLPVFAGGCLGFACVGDGGVIVGWVDKRGRERASWVECGGPAPTGVGVDGDGVLVLGEGAPLFAGVAASQVSDCVEVEVPFGEAVVTGDRGKVPAAGGWSVPESFYREPRGERALAALRRERELRAEGEAELRWDAGGPGVLLERLRGLNVEDVLRGGSGGWRDAVAVAPEGEGAPGSGVVAVEGGRVVDGSVDSSSSGLAGGGAPLTGSGSSSGGGSSASCAGGSGSSASGGLSKAEKVRRRRAVGRVRRGGSWWCETGGGKKQSVGDADAVVLRLIRRMRVVSPGVVANILGSDRVAAGERWLARMAAAGHVEAIYGGGWVLSAPSLLMMGGDLKHEHVTPAKFSTHMLMHSMVVNHVAACVWGGTLNVLGADEWPLRGRVDPVSGGLSVGCGFVTEREMNRSKYYLLGKATARREEVARVLGAARVDAFSEWAAAGGAASGVLSPELRAGNEHMFIPLRDPQLDAISFHLPDLVVPRLRADDGSARSVAVEVELGHKPASFRESLAAYSDAGGRSMFESVVWVCLRRRTMNTLERICFEMGLDDYVKVVPVWSHGEDGLPVTWEDRSGLFTSLY